MVSQPVNFCGQHKIALGEPVNFVGPNRNIRLAPAKADIGMVSLLLGKLADAIDEVEGLAKILEAIGLLQVMIVNYLPSLNLAGKLSDFLAREWRHSPAARYALAFG